MCGLIELDEKVTVEDDEHGTASAEAKASVEVTDVGPSVTLTKTPDPASMAEPGGAFKFTLTIKNTSVESVKITALTDTDPLSSELLALIGTDLAAGASVSGDYYVTHTHMGTYPDTAKVTVEDDEHGTASAEAKASVEVTDTPPVVDLQKTVTPDTLAEPGGDFTYTLTITNNSVEDVTITALTDTNTLSPALLALIGTTLTPGQVVSGSYTVTQTQAGTYDNTAEVTVMDNEQNIASATDTAQVTVTDVPPEISIAKTTNVTSVPETGGDVIYTFTVTNNSVEDVILTSLVDDIFGDLNGQGDCVLPQTIIPGGTYVCHVTKHISGDPASPHRNVITATALDNEENRITATDDAVVDFDQVVRPLSTGVIMGHKWNDTNGDGKHQPGEPGMAGITITLKGNGVTQSIASSPDGSYSFTKLDNGTYTVAELVPDTMFATSTASIEVTIRNGETVTDIDFNNAVKATVVIEQVTEQQLPKTGINMLPLLLASGWMIAIGCLLLALGFRRKKSQARV